MQKHVINIGLIVILATFIFILAGSGPLLAASAPQKSSKEPGTYEVRYILGQGSKMLDKAAITIK
jgi:hypothetical protein